MDVSTEIPTAAGFWVVPLLELKRLEEIFRHKVFKAHPRTDKVHGHAPWIV